MGAIFMSARSRKLYCYVGFTWENVSCLIWRMNTGYNNLALMNPSVGLVRNGYILNLSWLKPRDSWLVRSTEQN
ncbi:hypothetical protein ADA01nite_09730 [Aneurinibacillus danicus]|uniref:Uncharacterized protein n=1 Tax=Aneurinibacillus danicus TaxID=267746 RepID=A0A511V710_9BACL|nr:hypothetical protein ADA01nite_09730 [Aneurinibacillus danicus]